MTLTKSMQASSRPKLSRRVFAHTVLGLTAVKAQNPASAENFAKVTLHITDLDGHALPWRLTSFSSGGKDYVSRFNGLVGSQIPYGIYDYTIDSGWSRPRPVQGRVSIWQPECFVVKTLRDDERLGFAIDGAGIRGYTLVGHLEPPPKASGKMVWVRLRPLFSAQDEHEDYSVNSAGEFRMFEPPHGRYIVTVMSGDEVLHIQLISADGRGKPLPFIIPMPQNPPIPLAIVGPLSKP